MEFLTGSMEKNFIYVGIPEAVLGCLGFLLNAGILLILLRHKERDALLTLTMSLSLSDMLTGLFHASVLIDQHINFLDFGQTRLFFAAFQEIQAKFDSFVINFPNGSELSSMAYVTVEDFDIVSLFDTFEFYYTDLALIPNDTSAFIEEMSMNATFQPDMIRQFLSQENNTKRNDELLNKSLKHYDLVLLLINYCYTLPYITCILNMLGISVSVLIIVIKPLKQRMILSKSRVRTYVCIVWGFALSSSMGICIYTICFKQYIYMIYMTGLLSIVTLITSLLTFVALTLIYSVVLYVINCRTDSQLSKSKRRRSLKSVLTATAIVVSYSACYLPIMWTSIARTMFGDTNQDISIWLRTLPLLAASNTILDGLVYAYRLPVVSTKIASTRTCCMNILKQQTVNQNVRKSRDENIDKDRAEEVELEQKVACITTHDVKSEITTQNSKDCPNITA